MLIEKYYLTHLPFSYIPVCSWMDPEEFISSSSKFDVSRLLRLTLLYDGSLVKFFRALFLSDISVDVTGQNGAGMGLEMAKFLDVKEGTTSIVRDAWLKKDEQNLVYAHSVIDISSISDSLKRDINRKNKPLGVLLSDYNMPILRDQLFISRIKSDYLAGHFSTIEDTLWARCYRLRVSDGFNAAIMEVFSPDTWKN
ncbi:MAG: chorismate lyase [Nitrospirae bacterium]|nr:chorismate lyase [Nitrospirota bacterium]